MINPTLSAEDSAPNNQAPKNDEGVASESPPPPINFSHFTATEVGFDYNSEPDRNLYLEEFIATAPNNSPTNLSKTKKSTKAASKSR